MNPSDNLQITVIGIAAILIIGGVIWFGSGSSESIPDPVEGSVVVSQPAVLAVHVSGAVVRPGLVAVPDGSRVADAIAAAGGAAADAELTLTNLAAPVRDGEHVIVATRDASAPVGNPATTGVDLNTATAGELEALPGVGPVLAERIVSHRERFGRFATVEDLLDVTGIGEAKLAQMREAIGAP